MKKLPVKGVGLPADPTMLVQAFQDVTSLMREWKVVHEQETTKRTAITAQRDAMIERIRADRDVLLTFMKGSFEQQAAALEGLFKGLDKALESGDPDLVGPILTSIVETVKTSPLGDLLTLDQRMKDNSFNFVLGQE